MERRDAENISTLLKMFWADNPEIYHKMMEERVKRLWSKLFGIHVAKHTNNIYVRNRVLYVSMTSSVIRSELLAKRRALVKKLNACAGSEVIDDLVIR